MLSSRHVLALLICQCLSLSAMALRFENLLTREPRTNATCLPEFSWMNNNQGRTPCQLAAELIAPCHGGSWVIRDLPSNNTMYNIPAGSEAEGCTCSWAVYNLISACATCQSVPQAVRPWPDYKVNCPASAISNDSYYPHDRPLPDDVKFPSWAARNPDDWNGATYSLSEARSVWASEGASEVGQPEDPAVVEDKPSSSSAGPIAGGVVGGVVVLAAAAALAFFLLKQHRQKSARARGMAPSDAYSTHYRSPSDATDKSGFSMGYTNLSSTTAGFPPGRSATIRTHNTSIYPFSTFGAPDQVTAPPQGTQSPPPVTISPPPAANSPSPAHSRQTSGAREEIITPFVLQQPVSDATSGDRKTPLGNVPRYDSPNAPPTRADDALFATPQRGRMNPPAYSPHDTPSPPPMAAGPSRSHVKNVSSVDTHRTNPSISGNNAVPQAHFLASASRSTSTSDIYTSPPDSVSGVPEGTTLTRTGTTATSAFPRDIKQHPTDDSITGRDLA